MVRRFISCVRMLACFNVGKNETSLIGKAEFQNRMSCSYARVLRSMVLHLERTFGKKGIPPKKETLSTLKGKKDFFE